MTSSSSCGLSYALRRGAYGLAIALPLLAGPAASSISYENKIQKDLSLLEFQDLRISQSNDSPENPGQETVKDNSGQSQDSLPVSVEEDPAEKKVLITEVIIEGIDGHPEQERLEFVAYDAMNVRPGSRVTRDELKFDLEAIYATGWFSGVRIEPVNGPLGVQLVVEVQPNPLLAKVELEPRTGKLPQAVLDETFSSDFGRTLNLNDLQARMKQLREWYIKEGYSLARITGPNRVTAEGVVYLKVVEGTVAGVEVEFLNKEGDSIDENGNPVKGKTKKWVITREISIQPGETFNRNQLEQDLKSIYGTSLFSDVKVTLKPVPGSPGKVTIVLGIIEQSTGSLSGGIGYSQSQGVFGQVGLQESNFFGRSWSAALNLTYGQYGGLADITFTDPWLKGDKHRTLFRTSIFLSRDVPQAFLSRKNGTIRGVSDYYESSSNSTDLAYDIGVSDHGYGKFDSMAEAESSKPNLNWFDYSGNSVVLQRTGANLVFSRPLNGGDPYKKVPWSALVGLNVQKVRPISFAGESRPYGVATTNKVDGAVPDEDVICVGFNCAKENSLVGVRTAVTYNTLNEPRNPTSGDYATIGTEQFVSVGNDSPTFNRARVSYTHFIPVNWLKLTKGCNPKPGDKADCPQAVGVQFKAGTIIGQLPPYESFCLGGSSSVRGWSACDLAVGRSFGEATLEYRFPIWNIVSGEVFVDGGTDFDSQENVPGKPGKLLKKQGSGFSIGTGLIVTTPVGPLRLEAASQDLQGEWRFNLGVGWKF